MRTLLALVINAFVVAHVAHARDTDLAPRNRTDVARDLDDTVLGMPGHLVKAPRQASTFRPASFPARMPHSARTAYVPRAEPTNPPLGIRPKIENVGVAEDLAKEGKASESIGFRFDPATSKWIRDDKSGDKIANWADKGGAIERPLSGGAYTVWPVVYLTLLDRGLKQVDAKEALELVKDKGAVLVDVEVERIFKKGTMEGAVNVPLYQPVAGNALMDNLKKISMAAMGMQATERNPDFVKIAQERLPKDKPLIVACNRGGSMKTTVSKQKNGYVKVYEDPDKSFGIESRSLKACYELFQANFTNIYFLKGGINQYQYEGYPMGSGASSAVSMLAQAPATFTSVSSAVAIALVVSGGAVSFMALRFYLYVGFSNAGKLPLLASHH